LPATIVVDTLFGAVPERRNRIVYVPGGSFVFTGEGPRLRELA
jgi:hypothetical protein